MKIYFFFSILIFFIVISLTPSEPFPIERSFENRTSAILSTPDVLTPKFVDQTLSAGITFSHLQGDKELTGLDEVIGPGACAFDYDSDGWVDLFLVNGSGQTRFYGREHWWQQSRGHALYRNLGNGKFINQTSGTGLDKPVWGMGCVTGDFDNDGHPDLLVTTKGSNLLYKNHGNGKFTDITLESGITGERWSTSASLADYDGDGLVDIYIANYIKFNKGNQTYEANSQYGANIKPTFNPALYDAEENLLYRNMGNFKFQNVTKNARVSNSGGRSLDASWLDVNNDLKMDLLVINGFGSGSNTLYINQGNGSFKEEDEFSGIKTALGNTGIGLNDIDNDSDLDIILGSTNQYPPLLLVNMSLPLDNNNNASLKEYNFNDLSRTRGIADERFIGLMGWTPGLYDFNNDGWVDVFMSNGLFTPDPDAPKIPQGQPNEFWLNSGSGIYRKINDHGIAYGGPQSSRGSVFADFDNDGDIDIYVANNNDLGQLLINQLNNHHWLGIKLQGDNSNRDAIGSKIWLRTVSGTQFRVMTSGKGFMSDSDHRLHFGLGQEKQILEITIQWPDGSESEFKNPPIDRYITITQGRKGTENYASTNINKEPTSSDPQLIITDGDIKNRLLYLEWVIKSQGLESTLSELDATYQSEHAELRSGVIKLLGKYKSYNGLKHIINGLNDENTDVILAAIETLRLYEEESSVRWLLSAFNHPDEKVRTALAECFGFFFREEEAVVHRKHLAVPYLIRLLNDSSPIVRVSAAQALGDAENFRGVYPLIEKLNDPDHEVRMVAANALGHIRNRKAVAPLLQLLKDKSQTPKIHAQILIALKRLNYKFIDQEINDLFNGTIVHGLQTILEITGDTLNGIVFNHSQLINYVSKLENHKEHDIRKFSLQALILLSSTSETRKSYILKGLNDSDTEVRVNSLNTAIKLNYPVPKTVLLKLLKQPETAIQSLELLKQYKNNDITTKLLNLATNRRYTPETRAVALNVLGNVGGKLPSLPKSLINNNDNIIIKSVISYAGKLDANPKHHNKIKTWLNDALSNNEQSIQLAAIGVLIKLNRKWANQTIKELLINIKTETTIREYIIHNLTFMTQHKSMTWLLQLVRNSNDPLRLAAMKALTKRNNLKLDHLMWKLLKNPRENPDMRFLAARTLLPRHNKDVIRTLRGKPKTTNPKTNETIINMSPTR